MNNEEKAARIIRRPEFQALQEWFSRAYDIGTGIFDKNVRLLTYEVNHKKYCTCVRNDPAGFQKCRLSDTKLISDCQTTKKVCWHVCNNGLLDFGIPIRWGERGKTVAFLLAGQLRGEFRGLSTEKNGKICMKEILNNEFEDIPVFTAEKLEQIDEAARRFGKMLSVLLIKLSEWEPPTRALEEYVEKAHNAGTVDELLEISVDQFPKIIGSKECSIFRVGKVEDEGERLILKKTSYKPLEETLKKVKKVKAFYKYGEGLTGWVWKHGRSLKVRNIKNKAELMAIDKDDPPKWKGKLKDSPDRKEFLCVPIFGRTRGDVIGVVRTPMTMKEGGFTVDDEITLSALGGHLYSLIELCEHRERTMEVQKAFEIALNFQRCQSQTNIWEKLLSETVSFFGYPGKAYLINLLNPDGESFTISYVNGELAAKKNLKDRKFPLSGNTTGYLLNQQEPKPFLIHNIEKAQQEKRYFPAVKGGRSVMAVQIGPNKGHYKGIIGVVADKQYAFNEDDWVLLHNLAECADKACENLKISTAAVEVERLRLLSQILKGLMHDLGTPLLTVNNTLRMRIDDESAKLTELIDFTLNGLRAYQFSPAKSPSGELMGFDKSMIERVHRHRSTFYLKPLIEKCVKVLYLCDLNLPNVKIECPNDYEITADYEVLMLIIYNLLVNSKKYADVKRLDKLQISVSVKRDGEYSIITVIDCNEKIEDKIVKSIYEFKPDYLGLSLTNIFTKAHPGRPPSERGTFDYKRIRRHGKNIFTVEIFG